MLQKIKERLFVPGPAQERFLESYIVAGGVLLSLAIWLYFTFAWSNIGVANLLIILSLMVLLWNLVLERTRGRVRGTNPLTLDNRLARLTQALADAGQAISLIEQEIESRRGLVDTLESQKKIAEAAISLSREQVDAVSALLTQNVSRQSKRDSRIDWLREGFFFILGAAVTLLLSRLGLGG